MTDRRDAMQEDMRFRMLKLLDDSPEMSQRDLARAVGISLGSVNFQLKALVDKGMIKLGNFSANPDKRRYAYILTPRGIAAKAALTRRFLARKRAEYEALRAEIEALQSEIDGKPTASE
ncbi:MarR family EPS-associated transcriptional regulator [Tropicimonas sp. IMCC34011]|uniref:MarR family EPS-associated transcriptional regulator n=1 Tax=Tropicimonas sp. IMCC34011 TaxID=2248759 RepID=UPI000E226EF0|nr:MarR family EPS-associated transcriptional regulator [Tropicimonas sp. IMCC34011]